MVISTLLPSKDFKRCTFQVNTIRSQYLHYMAQIGEIHCNLIMTSNTDVALEFDAQW
jgi:hypothetical protein